MLSWPIISRVHYGLHWLCFGKFSGFFCTITCEWGHFLNWNVCVVNSSTFTCTHVHGQQLLFACGYWRYLCICIGFFVKKS